VWWARRVANAEGVKVFNYRRTKPAWRVFSILERLLPAALAHLHPIARQWYAEIENMNEAWMCWMVLVLAVLVDAPAGPLIEKVVLGDTWERNRRGEKLALDTYVLDRHTVVGRGTSLVEFALVGAHVENESQLVVAEHKRFYEDMKRFAENALPTAAALAVDAPTVATPAMPAEAINAAPSTETGAFDLVVRTQLSTGSGKSDVYFARRRVGGDLVVVKGPLASCNEADNALAMRAWKETHGLPSVGAELVYLVPDRWPEGVPLGVRNRLPRDQPAPFLVFESLVSEAALARRVHDSKMWPPTEVVDWDKVSLHLPSAAGMRSDTLTDDEWRDYVRALLARWLFGIGDLADRNFLRANGRVISIDEETRDKDFDFVSTLKARRCALVRGWLVGGGYETLGVDAWNIPEELAARLRTLQNKKTCLALFS
jgi:hypothetical protein